MSCRGVVQAGLQPKGLSTRKSSIHQQSVRGCPRLARNEALVCNALAVNTLQPGFGQRRLPACPSNTPSLQQQQGGAQLGSRLAPPKAIAGTLTATGIIPLGYDFLTFLTATVMVVPACKWLKISPVLGFLAAGVMLEQAG